VDLNRCCAQLEILRDFLICVSGNYGAKQS
jgi:hypothetical protein